MFVFRHDSKYFQHFRIRYSLFTPTLVASVLPSLPVVVIASHTLLVLVVVIASHTLVVLASVLVVVIASNTLLCMF